MTNASFGQISGSLALLFSFALNALTDPPGQNTDATYSDNTGQPAVVIKGAAGTATGTDNTGHASPVTARSFDCGPPSTGGSGVPNPSDACGYARNVCALEPGDTADPDTTIVVYQELVDGVWGRTDVDCTAPLGSAPPAPPEVTAAAVREQALRLIPTVPVGIAPATGPTLVNLETIFWVPTEAARTLDPVTILGQPVTITIGLDHVTWNWGDGTTTSTASPGTPWTPGSCDTRQCPDLDGHTYTHRADTLTITATITWTGLPPPRLTPYL